MQNCGLVTRNASGIYAPTWKRMTYMLSIGNLVSCLSSKGHGCHRALNMEANKEATTCGRPKFGSCIPNKEARAYGRLNMQRQQIQIA